MKNYTVHDVEQLIEAVRTMNDNSIIRQEMSLSTIDLDLLLSPFVEEDAVLTDRIVRIIRDRYRTGQTIPSNLAQAIVSEIQEAGWRHRVTP